MSCNHTTHAKATLRKCVHGRCSYSVPKRGSQQKASAQNPALAERREHQCEASPSKGRFEDPFKSEMKSLIAQNESYFQNKLNISCDGRPNNLKLKIPSHTGGTIYKRDYMGKNRLPNDMNSSQEKFVPNKPSKSNDFFDGTTYKTEFIPHKDCRVQLSKKNSRAVEEGAPVFHETQYKHTFLNWGGINNAPSMKPYHRPAVTNLPLQNSSTYSLDYNKKPQPILQSFKPVPSILTFKENAKKYNDCQRSSAKSSDLIYMTTSKLFYDNKNPSKQQSLKPKTQILGVSGSHFKGKTEYQGEYVPENSVVCGKEVSRRPLQELQALMLGPE